MHPYNAHILQVLKPGNIHSIVFASSTPQIFSCTQFKYPLHFHLQPSTMKYIQQSSEWVQSCILLIPVPGTVIKDRKVLSLHSAVHCRKAQFPHPYSYTISAYFGLLNLPLHICQIYGAKCAHKNHNRGNKCYHI